MFKILNLLINNKTKRNLIERKTKIYGKYEIKENEIVCYVDENKLNKGHEKGYISFQGIFGPEIRNLEKLNINKPFHYIIDGITFKYPLVVVGGQKSCHITFKNCVFEYGLTILSGEEITLDNNKHSNFKNKNTYLILADNMMNKIERLRIINTEMYNGENLATIKAKNLIIENSTIYSSSNLMIETEMLQLTSADISFEKTNINAHKIISKDSHIGSGEKILLIKSDYIQNLYVTGENIIINDEKIGSVIDEAITLNINDIEKKKQEQIQKLVEVINQINKKCNKKIEKVLEENKKTKIKTLLRTK